MTEKNTTKENAPSIPPTPKKAVLKKQIPFTELEQAMKEGWIHVNDFTGNDGIKMANIQNGRD